MRRIIAGRLSYWSSDSVLMKQIQRYRYFLAGVLPMSQVVSVRSGRMGNTRPDR